MSAPKRIQMSRQRPWRHEHPDAVIVARPSKWGNPFRVGSRYETHRDADMTRTPERAVRDYRAWLTAHHPTVDAALVLEHLPELAGRDLACWCPLDSPCHADVLLELANPVHDHDPVLVGCRRCGALPFEGVPCEPPEPMTTTPKETDR